MKSQKAKIDGLRKRLNMHDSNFSNNIINILTDTPSRDGSFCCLIRSIYLLEKIFTLHYLQNNNLTSRHFLNNQYNTLPLSFTFIHVYLIITYLARGYKRGRKMIFAKSLLCITANPSIIF